LLAALVQYTKQLIRCQAAPGDKPSDKFQPLGKDECEGEYARKPQDEDNGLPCERNYNWI
jgi:hypothetical protein